MPALPEPSPDAARLTALRTEIDGIDDALHDLLMRRAAVIARLAESGAKAGPTLRPGREAAVLRRLLARHRGPLPPAAVVRIWREVFAAGTAQQGAFAVALHAPRADEAALAAQHFGLLTPLRLHPTPSRALAAVAAGEASVAVLPMPREGEPAEAAWWLGLDAPRLTIVARLPFWSAAAEPDAEALVVAPGPADPTGADRSLLRLEGGAERGRAQLVAQLTAVGLLPRALLLHRGGGERRALVELDGTLDADDPRLARLGADRALPLGAYAVPERGRNGARTGE